MSISRLVKSKKGRVSPTLLDSFYALMRAVN
jgi:hypothetical protein